MRITLGIPIIQAIPGECVHSLIALAVEIGRDGEMAVSTSLNVFPHDRARNKIIKDAVETDSEYLFFADSDHVFPPRAFERMLFVMQEKECVMVTGHTLRRGYPYTNTWFKNNEKGELCNVTASGNNVYEIDACGLGCALINIPWIVENLEEPFFKTVEGRPGTDHEKEKPPVGEDIHFCERVREKGGVIYGDARVRCGHVFNRMIIDDETSDLLRKMHLKAEREHGENGKELGGNLDACYTSLSSE